MIRVSVVTQEGESFLQLPKSVQINFDHKNPATSLDAAIPGAFHLGLRLAVEPNAAKLATAHFLQIAPATRAFDVRVYQDGLPVRRGSLLVETATVKAGAGEFDCSLVAEGIGVKLEGQGIRSLFDQTENLGETSQEVRAAAAAKNNQAPEVAGYCFPQYKNLNHFGGSNEGDEGEVFVNWWDQAAAEFAENAENPEYDLPAGIPKWLNRHTLAPSVYVHEIFRRAFALAGYTVSGDYMESVEHAREIVLGLYSLDRYDDRYAATVRLSQDAQFSPTWQAPAGNFFENAINKPFPWDVAEVDTTTGGVNLGEWQQVFPIEVAGTYVVRLVLFLDTDAVNELKFYKVTPGGTATAFYTPASYLGAGQHILEHVEGITAGYVGGAIYATLNDIFSDQPTVLANTQMSVVRLDENTRNVFRGTFNLGDALPDISAKEFLSNAKRRWGLHFVVDQDAGDVRVGFLADILKRPPFELDNLAVSVDYEKEFTDAVRYVFGFSDRGKAPDWTRYQGAVLTVADLPETAPASQRWLYWVASRNAFYIFDLNEDETAYTWQQIEENQWQQTTGEGEDKAVKINNAALPMEDDGDALFPVLDESGNSDLYGLGRDGFEERYLFFYGMQPGEGGTYPFASQGAFDRGETQLGQLQQTLSDQAGGIGTPFTAWKSILDATNGAPRVKVQLQHDTRAEQIPTDRPVRFRAGLYLVENIEETASHDGRSVALTLVKLNP